MLGFWLVSGDCSCTNRPQLHSRHRRQHSNLFHFLSRVSISYSILVKHVSRTVDDLSVRLDCSLILGLIFCSIEGNFPNLTLYFSGGAAMTLSPSNYLHKQILSVSMRCVFQLPLLLTKVSTCLLLTDRICPAVWLVGVLL